MKKPDNPYWTPNVYNAPEEWGTEIVAVYSDDDLSYEFNMFVVWRDLETGYIFYANDSGCSCPSPFEWVDGPEDVTWVRDGLGVQRLVTDIYNWSPFNNRTQASVVSPTEIAHLIRNLNTMKEDE